MLRSEYGRPTNITGAATTVCKTGPGVLTTIVINKATTGTITIYDNTAASGTKIGTIAASTAAGSFDYQCQFTTGLTIVNGSTEDITVVVG